MKIVKPVEPLEVVKVIDFENIPLTTVISKIEEVYGVEIENVPKMPKSITSLYTMGMLLTLWQQSTIFLKHK